MPRPLKTRLPFRRLPAIFPERRSKGWRRQLARRLNYQPGDDLLAVVRRLGGRIEYTRLISDLKESGTLEVKKQGDFVIRIPSFTGPLRDRFTIAHELGHYALHSRFGEIPLKVARHGSDRAEWEANWFAGALLMPEEEFRARMRETPDDGDLAHRFHVSRAAVQIRKKTLAA